MAFSSYRLTPPSSSSKTHRPPFGSRRWVIWAKRICLALLGLGVIGIFAFTIFIAWVSRDLPDPNSLSTRVVPQSTRIYDRTGTHLLYEIHGDQNRTLVKIQDIPLNMQHATIAIEDKKFYEHHGIYWEGLVRAVLVSIVTGHRVEGTSTITQQLVKNTFLTDQRSLLRKAREFVLALQIERTYSKDQILQMYLNTIPYGSDIYGVESASQTYFGKSSKDLTLDEAALLASIPQAPDLYSPYGTGAHGDNRTTLVARQHYVLEQMAQQGYITEAQAKAAIAINTLAKLQPQQYGEIHAPHFVMYVRSLLDDAYGQQQVEEGGLKVITTLDWDKQQIAEDEVTKGVDARGKAYHFTNAALVSLDPKTGQILAMVGSKDFFDPSIDGQVNVALRPRQPGSSFKPIVYSLAFTEGYLPQTQLWDVDTVFKTDTGTYEPKNYDLKNHGLVTMRQALQGSLNIPAVKTLYLVGVSRVLDFAQRLGYTTLDDRSRFGLSLVLGGGEVTPLEHASAYSAFANDGVRYPTSAILSVQDSNGNTLQSWQQPQGTQAVDPQAVRLLNDVLTDNASRAFVFGLHNYMTLPDRPVAAKTGTTNNFIDAWTAGYTPSLTTVVWVGNSDGSPMKTGADGSEIAAPIWQGYMERALQGTPVEHFIPPDPPQTTNPVLLGQVMHTQVKIDRVSGKLATDLTPPADVVEQTDYVPHSILYYIDKDDPTGPPPTDPTQDPQFINWETAVQNWLAHSVYSTNTAPTSTDDVHTTAEEPQVNLMTPSNNQVVTTREMNIQATIQGVNPITSVEAVVDNNLLGTATAAPWNFNILLPTYLSDGQHTLTVTAIDSLGNRGSAQINFQLDTNGSAPENTAPTNAPVISTPPPPVVSGIHIQPPTLDWAQNSSQIVDITLDNPQHYQQLTLQLTDANGQNFPLTTVSAPFTASLHLPITLPDPLQSGAYSLNISGTTSDGGATETAQTPVTISS